MRSKAARKCYPLHQSPLYKIKGKGQFEKIINIEFNDIDDLISQKNYHVFQKDGRIIQSPHGQLANVHNHIGKLLSRIEMPDYLYSQKERSYVHNAKQHVGNHCLIKTDIHKFYPSTTRLMVYHLFKFDFECAADIASRLADICCYRQQYLPTGSPLSGYVAFLSAKPMFDEIANLATSKHCKMTVYVDDVTISGQAATKEMLWEIRKIIYRYGFKTKSKKSIFYKRTLAKEVTGSIIFGNDLRLPNKRHLKILETRREIEKASAFDRKILFMQLKGRLQEARQIIGSP